MKIKKAVFLKGGHNLGEKSSNALKTKEVVDIHIKGKKKSLVQANSEIKRALGRPHHLGKGTAFIKALTDDNMRKDLASGKQTYTELEKKYKNNPQSKTNVINLAKRKDYGMTG